MKFVYFIFGNNFSYKRVMLERIKKKNPQRMAFDAT